MQVEELIQLLQRRGPKQDICVEVFGTQLQIQGVEINNEHANGVKISLCVDDYVVEFGEPEEPEVVTAPTSITVPTFISTATHTHAEFKDEDDE